MKVETSPQSSTISNESQYIWLHGEEWVKRQRIAGQCASEVMGLLTNLVKEKTSLSLIEIDKLAETEILKRGCSPTFKGYKGFPNAICQSVNKQIVHGIATDYRLQEGDLISFDFGATFEGAIADTAITLIYGEPKLKEHLRLLETTQECLYNAIRAIKPGKRLGIIGNAVYKTATNAGFNVVQNLGGHSISWNQPHAFIFVSNKSSPEEGIRIQPGLTLAIEPLLTIGDTKTTIDKDGWTISCPGINAHYEHSIMIHSDRIEIMSYRPEEANKISKEIYFDKN